MSGKKNSWQTKAAKSWHIWLQDSELQIWFGACCLSCWFKKSLLRSLH